MSVSCGIPDFRSRDGIYARLSKEYPDLPDPQAMFDIKYFRSNTKPFYKFAKVLKSFSIITSVSLFVRQCSKVMYTILIWVFYQLLNMFRMFEKITVRLTLLTFLIYVYICNIFLNLINNS